uniref:Uncharacterized protein n=1 Tax=Setaria digitata TaxID=48799 RepID=A0A915PRM1_9BILA
MYGIVVTPPLNETEIMHAVHVEGKISLLFIKRVPTPNRAKLTKAERKVLDKAERIRSLTFGDWIEFEEQDVNEGCIEKYVKIYPLNRSRTSGDYQQARINCCWISVEVTRISCLNVELGEYIDVSEEQTVVTEAPWNRKDPRFVTMINSDESDSDLGDTADQESYPYEIYDIQGVLVSERNVYSSKYPDVMIMLAYVRRERHTPVGTCIHFNAYYSIPLQSYVIRSYRHSEKKPFTSKPFEFGSLILLEVYANWEPDLPMGHLWSKDKDLGLIHDLDGLLLPALLGKNPYAPVCVYVADTGLSRLSRFAIKDLSDMATEKTNAVMNSGYAEISDSGLVLGEGSVLCTRYLCLKIRFDNNSPNGWNNLIPGTWIKFTASSSIGIPDFKIRSWNSATNPLLVQINAILTCSGYAFETRGCFEQELSAVKSPIFGFIEIPHEKRSLMNPKDKGVTIVWVREDKRNGKARFIFHSVEVPQSVDVGKTVEKKSVQSLANNVEKPVVSCKGIECEGRQLLQRCFNNRTIMNSLIQASADELLTSIVKLLTAEKPED